jgi:hypothetical protein
MRTGWETKEDLKKSLIRAVKGVMLGLVLMFTIAYIGAWLETGSPPALSSSSSQQVAPSTVVRRNPWDKDGMLAGVRLRDVHLRKGGFAHVPLLDFTLQNHNAFAVNDVTVQCDGQAPSGTRLAVLTKVVYRDVKAYGETSVVELNMGFVDEQVVRAECAVTDLVVVR